MRPRARRTAARFRALVLVIAALGPALLAGACASGERGGPATGDGPALVGATDKDPDPNVIAIDLEAKPTTKRYRGGPETPVWTYNGTVPGPLVDAKVGDRLVVHFVNSLPEPTTVHWHGVRLPAAMDGAPMMQEPIPPGGKFEYAFTLKDAGLYWFHPHVRSDLQVEKGLYGVIRVRGAAEPAVDDEQILVLDDVRLKADGTVDEALNGNARMMGREGDTVLVNGAADATFDVRPGALVRLRIVSAANGGYFNLRADAGTLHVLGSDGSTYAAPERVDHVLVAPGERYDLLLQTPSTGETVTLIDDPYDRGHGTGREDPRPVATLRLRGDVPPPRALPSALPVAPRLPYDPKTVTTPIVLGEKRGPDGTIFTINGEAHPAVPPIRIPRGEVRFLDVRNDTDMDHPFHLHGFFFQVVEADGEAVPAERILDKDTVNVRRRDTMRLLVRFDEPGHWMYHCHILEHGELGMMGHVLVE